MRAAHASSVNQTITFMSGAAAVVGALVLIVFQVV